MSPERYRRVTRAALWSLVAIVITGAAVRLTGSGLGCSDWPNCSAERFVPEREFHGLVEFVNRLFTGVVSVAVIVAVLGSQVRAPRRRDLTLLSWGLVVGVLAQIVLGAVTVLTHLRPEVVMAHFLLSMVLVLDAVVLHHRAGISDDDLERRHRSGGARSGPRSSDEIWSLGLAAMTSVVIFLGTIVTAAGPHAGDEEAPRLGVDLPDAARSHGASVWVLLALTVAFFIAHVRRPQMSKLVTSAIEYFAGALLVQGTIGYVQYFNGTPAVLVGLHIAGACAVWITVLRIALVAHDEAMSVAAEAELQLT